MRHQVAGRKLGKKSSHRWAMFRNMATSLVEHERIETTLHKAKELRSIADSLITLAKRNDLHARRQALQFIRSDLVVAKLFSDLAPRFKDRNGGYTRVLHLGERVGDAAPMALIEYLPDESAVATSGLEVKKGEKKASPRKAAVTAKKATKVDKEVKKKEKAEKKVKKAEKKAAANAKKEAKKPAKKKSK